MLGPVTTTVPTALEALFVRATERIRSTPACNFPLVYAPMHIEYARHKHLMDTQPWAVGNYADECRMWLQAILDAPEADLVLMVQRHAHTIGQESPQMIAQRAAMDATMAGARQAEASRPRLSPAEFVASLAQRGITLSADKHDGLSVHPARLLTEADRGVIRGLKADLVASLRADVEVF